MTDGQRFEALDLVRGLCALAVAIYHYLAWTHDVIVQSAGTFGVYIFFILSALALMIKYGGAFRNTLSANELADFAIARVARILPLLVLVAVVRAGMELVGESEPIDVLSRALLTGSALMALQLPGFLSNAVGAWTLGIEAAFYMVFPLAALFANAANIRTIAIVLGASILGQQALLYLIAPLSDAQHWEFYTTPLTFAPFFIIGLLIYRFRPDFGFYGLPVALLLLLAVFSVSLWTDADIFRSAGLYIGLTALSAGVIYFAFGATMPSFLGSISQFLGDVSYSLYLTHWFVYSAVNKLVAKGVIDPRFQIAVFLVAALATAWLSFRLFELPAKNWIRSAGRKAARAEAPPSTAP